MPDGVGRDGKITVAEYQGVEDKIREGVLEALNKINGSMPMLKTKALDGMKRLQIKATEGLERMESEAQVIDCSTHLA